MPEINLLNLYPKARRDVRARRANKEANRRLALQYGFEYFDGNREQGYGGYVYDGRWVPIARTIVEHYGLKPGQRVLDIGCAKGFLVRDLMAACPGLEVWGLDISDYAIRHAHPEAVGRLVRGSADALPFPDGWFDAALCINVIHNLDAVRCRTAIREVMRVAPKHSYIQVDAYRSETERDLFLDWVLTAVSYGTPRFWTEIFDEVGYRGDYYWTIIEAEPQ